MIRRSFLKRGKPPQRKAWFKRSTKPIPQVNVEAKAKRDKRYRAHLSSAYWKKLRRERWEMVLKMFGVGTCENCGALIESLSGAHLGHRTYARFGHELIDDVEIDCPPCNTGEAALRGKRIRRTA